MCQKSDLFILIEKNSILKKIKKLNYLPLKNGTKSTAVTQKYSKVNNIYNKKPQNSDNIFFFSGIFLYLQGKKKLIT